MSASELDEFLADASQPDDYPDDTEPGWDERPWEPQDDSAADWCLQKLRPIEAELAAKQALYQERLDQLNEWWEHVSTPLLEDAAHWRMLLERYAVRKRAQTGAKTVSLPNGEITTRTQAKGGAIEINEEDALAIWLQSHPELEEVWCKYDPKPLITKIRPNVAIVSGSICAHCGSPIVRQDDHLGHWVSALGAACPKEHVHLPAADDDGVIVAQPVAVYQDPLHGEIPVPGLGVRQETVVASVKVAS